ncbi:MAG: AAA family ATPase [Proteobacteria bacterium]|nr:AAA family ATPase [Pseudomonadota bacterium]
MTDRDDLRLLVAGGFPLITIETCEEPRVIGLLRMLADGLDVSLARWSVTDGLVTLLGADFFSAEQLRLVDDTTPNATRKAVSDPETALRAIRGSRQAGLILLLDFHPFFDNPVHVRLIKEIAQDYEVRHQKLVFISHALRLPDELKSFAAAFDLSLPNSIELSRMIAEEAELWASRGGNNKVRAEAAAVSALVDNLGGLTRTDARRLIRTAIRDDGAITRSDVSAVSAARYAILGGDGLLSFEFDTASLDDIGGLHRLKHWLGERHVAFKDSTAVDRPRGLMLLGVQGGGKSLAAKAVAGVWNIPLLRLDFGVLYNKYFGETEANMRKVLATAETLAPCVLWCDEIEKGIATGDNDNGTSRRVLGTLLTWMAENHRPVFVVATANNIAELPPELLRKGRMDEIFFVDLPNVAARKEIFAIHLARRALPPAQFNLDNLAAHSEGFSGAEIEQAVVSARYAAQAREVAVDEALLLAQMAATQPLSAVIAEQVAALRAWADGRTVAAD